MKSENWGIILALVSFLALSTFVTQCGKLSQKKMEYKGILVEIYYDRDNRGARTYKIQTSDGIVKQTTRSYPESFDYIELGDSIIKEKGRLQIKVKKKKYDFKRYMPFSYE